MTSAALPLRDGWLQTRMTMLKPGDIVTVDFPGVTGVKRRPAVVVSTADYQRHRPDVILGIITSQVADATTPLDYVL